MATDRRLEAPGATAVAPARPRRPGELQRVGLVSVHTSPLDQPGTGDGGGLNVYVRHVAAGLARRGVEVDIFTRRADPQQPPSIELEPGVQVHHIHAGPARPLDKDAVANHLCGFALAMQRHPTMGTHDVLHAHYWFSGWVARRVARRFSTPFVQTFHTLGVLKNRTLAPGDRPEPPLRLIAEARIANDADEVVVLTCGEARLMYKTYGLSGRKLAVVPPGVDLSRFRPDPDPDDTVDVSPGPQLLFVGRLQPLKGPDVAIRTLALVRETFPTARLKIIGGTSGSGHGTTDPSRLHALADELGVGAAVVLEPAVDQATLARRYRAADVVLVPSRSETFGLVALEAQACGTPVVAADVPGLDAVVKAGGTRVPGHDPADHAAAVVRYLADPAAHARASAAGIATAQAASWDRTVELLLDRYAEVADQRVAA